MTGGARAPRAWGETEKDRDEGGPCQGDASLLYECLKVMDGFKEKGVGMISSVF